MAQKIINKSSGLNSFKNELGLDDGTLTVADNVVIDKDNIINCRRGFRLYGNSFSATVTDRAKQLLQYKGRMLVHYANKLAYDDGSGNFTNFSGDYSELSSGLRIKSVESNGNLYFTTNNGVKVIEALDASEFSSASHYIKSAGVPKALDIVVELATDTDWLESDHSSPPNIDKMTAYRMCWARKDINNNLKLGAVSSITAIRNTTGGGRSTKLTFPIPTEIRDYCLATSDYTSFAYQIYRDIQKDNETAGQLNVPEDEMNLVFQDYPTPTEITQGYVNQIPDLVAEDFRSAGTPLYTNPISGDGINSNNERPPLCKDITKYKDFVFYANTSTVHKLFFDVLAVDDWFHSYEEYADIAARDAATKIVGKIYKVNSNSTYYRWNDSTLAFDVTTSTDVTKIYIGDSSAYDTYTAAPAEDVGTNKFQLFTGGTPSQDIDDTVRSLIKIINRNIASEYQAFYLTGPNDLPGQVVLERKEIVNEKFYIGTNQANSGTDTDPKIPAVTPVVPFVTTFASDNEQVPNRSYYSKSGIPEAVPILNYVDVGSKDSPILRVIALRESLFFLKTDGIYRLSGTVATDFVVTLTDSSSPLIAADTAQVLNNQIYMLTNQGIVTLTDSSTSIISRNIEDLILKPTSHKYPNFSTQAFAITYETDRAYLLFLPTLTTDTTATQCFRFNIFTRTWTRLLLAKTCGIVNRFDDRIYLGPVDVASIEIERKEFDRTDYADRSYTKLLTSNSVVKNIIAPNSMSNIAVHDVIVQSQYITNIRFNRLLGKLDLDWLLTDNDYSSLEVDTGVHMGNALAALIAKIDADDETQTYTPYSGSTDVEDIRDGYNLLMQELNASSGVAYSDYREYTDLLTFESLVDVLYSSQGKFALEYEIPLQQGECILYKGIPTYVEYSAETLGDASLMKHFRGAGLMFDQFNFSHAEMGFRSDISNGIEIVEFEGEGNGAFGSQDYGFQTYGGDGGERPFRTLVPRNKQRCRFLYIIFKHSVARENFALIGYSVTYNDSTTDRAYKR